jgi:lipid A disaccharide synthetase
MFLGWFALKKKEFGRNLSAIGGSNPTPNNLVFIGVLGARMLEKTKKLKFTFHSYRFAGFFSVIRFFSSLCLLVFCGI